MADADTAPADAPPASPLDVVRENFNRLTPRQKLAGAAAIALSIAIFVGVWSWSKQPTYAVLFSGLSDKDGGAIITALQTQNIPYKVAEHTGAILVPSQHVGELRLKMATQGLPRGGNVGFELMENERIGTSQFNEQVNYQRALEGELGNTIGSLTQVERARVHLAIPKQTAFLRDEQKPTASVVLSLYPGRTLDAGQIAGIVHLVASSVPQLASEAVSIIDQSGKLLTTQPDPLRMAGLDPTQLEYVHEVETRYAKRINDILEPVVGVGNLRAQVTADVNFDQQEQTAETFRPNPSPDQAIRSQQTAENNLPSQGPAGVPGALSNQPPVSASAPITSPPVSGASGVTANGNSITISRNATTNYELDKTVQHTKKSLGQIKRLSVAVVVNYRTERDKKGNVKTAPLSETELKQLSDLVRETVGYSQQRGDTVNVANAPFTQVEKADEDQTWWKDPDNKAMARESGRYVLFALLAILLWFAVLRPLVRTVQPPKPEPEPEEEEEPVVETGPRIGADGQILDEDLLPPEVLAEEIAQMSFERKLVKAREIALKNPKVIATLLKEWMGTNVSDRR